LHIVLAPVYSVKVVGASQRAGVMLRVNVCFGGLPRPWPVSSDVLNRRLLCIVPFQIPEAQVLVDVSCPLSY